MSLRSHRVVVIGAGAIGVSCAYHLAKSGRTVVLLDRGRVGGGCSHGNCGFVSPSHVLPLAEPGAITGAMQAMLSPNSPFKIRARLDPALWMWLLAFARKCNHRDMMHGAKAIAALLDSSAGLYRGMIAAERFDCEFQQRGLLFVHRDRASFEAYAETDRLLEHHFGHGAVRYSGDELVRLEPALKPGLAGAWFHPGDAHLRPDKLMSAWRAAAQRAGVQIVENCAFDGFVEERGAARAVTTAHGEFAADAFVLATGAWTPLLSRGLGCRVPIQPGKGYSMTMPRPARCPVIPMIFPETRVAVTPMESGYRLGSTMEFAGYDGTLNPARLQLLRDGSAPFLHEPYCEPVVEQWFGWRPMTYDSVPIIDFAPALPNVLIAAGHNMLGVSMATGTGKLVTEMLGGETPHVDPRPYSVRRFGR
jgi:D-amino-acid dehydrogenase